MRSGTECGHKADDQQVSMTVEKNAEILRKWFKDENWNFEEKRREDGVSFVTGVSSESKVYGGYDILVDVRDTDFQSRFAPPVCVTEALRPAVMEFITRVNYAVRYGKFVMDLDDGELRYESVVDANGSEKCIRKNFSDLFALPGFVLDKFMPGVAAVLLGLKTPKKAFEDCQGEGEGEGNSTEANEEKFSEGNKKCKVRMRKSKAKNEQTGDKCVLTDYSLNGLNIQGKIPLDRIVEAVKRFRNGKSKPNVDTPRLDILLSGVPGSGKTAFAKYLASAAGAPIRVVRASDILSRYVGATEKRLAQVFEEAKEKNEILFLDEIDSFLQDRASSDHAWEVTQVNELLQQMEGFGGVMIGATNYSDCLDKAVLRRFTFKLKLDYLTNEGKKIFFDRYFKTPLTSDEQVRLNSIEKLTPGDFRTVREGLFYLSDKQTNDERLAALEAESEAKGRDRAKIGF